MHLYTHSSTQDDSDSLLERLVWWTGVVVGFGVIAALVAFNWPLLRWALS